MDEDHIFPDNCLRYTKVASRSFSQLRKQIYAMPHGLSYVAQEIGWSVGKLETWLAKSPSEATLNCTFVMIGIVGEALKRRSRFARLDGVGNLGDVSPDDKSRTFEDPSITEFKENFADLFSSDGEDLD